MILADVFSIPDFDTFGISNEISENGCFLYINWLEELSDWITDGSVRPIVALDQCCPGFSIKAIESNGLTEYVAGVAARVVSSSIFIELDVKIPSL